MRTRFFHIITVLALLTLFSCRKETSIERPGSTNGTFMAAIDGGQWIAADTLKSATIIGGLINLTGISSDNKQLSITLNDSIPGVYTLNQNSTSIAAFVNNDSSDLYAYTTNQGTDSAQAGGTVTVIDIDRVNQTITGTFSFNVFRDIDKKEKSITDGIFFKLPYSTSFPPANQGDTMYAVIEGQNWAAKSILGSSLSNTLIINGSALNGAQAVTLMMPLDVVPGGPYTLDYTGFTYYGLYSPVVTAGFASTSGNLTILENDPINKRVRGHFDFLASDPTNQSSQTYHLTAGYFSVQYQ